MNEYNASDLRSIRKATKAAKQAEADRRGVIFSLMSSPSGRTYIHDHLSRCHIFASSFSSSALGMAFAEGERNVGLQTLNDVMQFAPDQYIQMMREANDRRSNDSGHLRDNPNPRRDDLGRADDAGGSVLSDYNPIDGDVGEDAADGQGGSEG